MSCPTEEPESVPDEGVEEILVALRLPSELLAYLQDVAAGRGQSLDDMLSERLIEFKETYGFL